MTRVILKVNVNTGRCHTEQAEVGDCFGGMARMFTAIRFFCLFVCWNRSEDEMRDSCNKLTKFELNMQKEKRKRRGGRHWKKGMD